MLRLKQGKISLRKVAKFYTRLYAGGKSSPLPQHTNVCKISRLWGTTYSLAFQLKPGKRALGTRLLAFNKSTLNLAMLLIFCKDRNIGYNLRKNETRDLLPNFSRTDGFKACLRRSSRWRTQRQLLHGLKPLLLLIHITLHCLVCYTAVFSVVRRVVWRHLKRLCSRLCIVNVAHIIIHDSIPPL